MTIVWLVFLYGCIGVLALGVFAMMTRHMGPKGSAVVGVIMITVYAFAIYCSVQWYKRGACVAHSEVESVFPGSVGETYAVTCREGFEHREWDKR